MELKEILWKALGLTAAIAAASATRSALETTWRRTRKADPPANPASPSTGWGEAIAWAALTGMAVGVARMLAERGAAESWRAVAGDLPPGLEEVV